MLIIRRSKLYDKASGIITLTDVMIPDAVDEHIVLETCRGIQ